MIANLAAIPAVAAAIALAVAPLARFAWRRIRRRATQRNVAGCCAQCGLPWSEIGVAVREYVVDGARVCAPCAQRLRYRTIVEYGALVATTALVSGVSFSELMKYWRWTPWWGIAWVASTPVLLAAATALAVRRMKQRNQSVIGGDSNAPPSLQDSPTPRDDGAHDGSSADPLSCLAPAI